MKRECAARRQFAGRRDSPLAPGPEQIMDGVVLARVNVQEFGDAISDGVQIGSNQKLNLHHIRILSPR